MLEQLKAFLDDLDASILRKFPSRPLDLYHIGRSAIVWEYEATTTTQDFDVLAPATGDAMWEFAVEMFGQDTDQARRHGIYLHTVPQALPPMPANYQSRATQVTGPWKALRIYHLEPNDLAASKLKRFAARDREDIRFLCDRDKLDASILQSRLESAFYWHQEKDGNPDRDAAFKHLEIVKQYLQGEIHEF